jgi:crotonobetainyl-CoA:carnitine CoA-transferase CaiB-like acyl-CoA transferase
VTDSTLEGVRILDMTVGLAPAVATLLLAESGADVVKLEPPEPGPDRALAGFRTWSRSKRSAVVDLGTAGGRADLERFLAGADVLVHELGPVRAEALGLDDASLSRRHPHLIVSSVLSWPANHPDADRPVDELLAMARLGVCDEQMPVRRDGPVYVRFPLGSWCAAYLAAAGILARLIRAGRGGPVGPAHTSLAQGALVPMGMHWHRSERPSPALAAGMPKASRGSQATIFQCSDGEWLHLMGDPTQAPEVRAALGALGGGSAPDGAWGGGDNLAAALGTRPRHEWLEAMWAADVPVQPCLPYGAAFDDAQAWANRYLVELDDPEVGPVTMGGLPLTVTPPQQVRGPAPVHGAHTADVLHEWTPRAAPPRPAPARWPLEGVKVLDLGSYLAGPYGPMLLADLGADVIKVESTAGDAMRPTTWAFVGCQRGKRGVALDLRRPDARRALEALVGWADVVHHNVRTPAARRLGIDAESIWAVNPSAVYCHTSAYGPAGERADWPGYDQLFQAACGWERAGAGEDNPPMWHRFGFMDHLCAMSSVVATLLALYRRDRTGAPSAVAGSLLGAGVLTMSETYRRPDGTLAPTPTLDADQLGVSEGRRLVELADGWVAVAADTEAQLGALRTVGLAGRKVADALADLDAVGVPAEAVRLDQMDAFFDDPANRAAGLVASYPQADWGRMDQPGALWHFGDLSARLELAPPALGEHTVDCLTEAGLSREAIDALLAAGVAQQR